LKRYKAILIGITFIIAVVLFIWGYNFLKGKNVFSKEIRYYATYEDVSGLTVANPIMINGLRIGQVSHISFSPDMSGEIVVEMILNRDFPLPKNTVARIFSADLMGSKVIDLQLGNDPEMAQHGDTLASSMEASLKEEVNAQVQPIKHKAENLLSSIDSLVTAIQTVFNENARDNLAESFNNIRETFSNLENATSNIDTLVDQQTTRIGSILLNVDSVTYVLKENRESIAKVIKNLEVFSDTLTRVDVAGTFNRANKSLDRLDSILVTINEGQGTLGMLMHNDTLYLEVEKSASELNKLLKDIRENPKRYVKFSLF
jgi:phospholipid/cholesterol/gamma-HCH transport system substrate-binding protein